MRSVMLGIGAGVYEALGAGAVGVSGDGRTLGGVAGMCMHLSVILPDLVKASSSSLTDAKRGLGNRDGRRRLLHDVVHQPDICLLVVAFHL